MPARVVRGDRTVINSVQEDGAVDRSEPAVLSRAVQFVLDNPEIDLAIANDEHGSVAVDSRFTRHTAARRKEKRNDEREHARQGHDDHLRSMACRVKIDSGN